MNQHYRHPRVAKRDIQPDHTLCDWLCQPLVGMGLILLLFIILLKCLICHR